jgi:hypothetical protein
MYAFNRSFNRRVVVGIVAVLMIVVTAILLLPGSALARADEPPQAAPRLQQAGPPLPPPPPLQITPPIATPEPGAVEAGAGAQAGSSDVEIIQFQPKVQLVPRQKVVSSQGVDKPEGDRSADLEKPPAEQRIGPQEGYTPPDYEELFGPLDWGAELYEDFEGAFPGAWILEDFGNDGYERLWGRTDWYSWDGSWSAWPAAGGIDALDPWSNWYTDNLDSWMEYGPFDFSNVADAYVGFGLWYDTEPEYDRIYFCASTDFVNYSCDYWSGYSGDWTDQVYSLTSYAGYPQVWLAWVFQSDESNSLGYEGPFVDEIYVYGDRMPVEGQLIENGSFEEEPDHLIGWTGTDGVGTTDTTYVDGQWSAFLWQEDGAGGDLLDQTFDVPADVTDVVLNYWFAVTTDETLLGRDFFCASLRPAALGPIWVDLGCIDSLDASGEWQQVVYTLTSSEVDQVKGQTVALTFEMYDNGTSETSSAGWVDAVQVQAVGGGGGGYLDLNEPNDTWESATAITCDTTITGTIGDALGGYDVDMFELGNVPVGQIDIDIAADVKDPPSALDSVVGLWDSNLDLLDWKDDDGVSYDSYLVYTNTVPGATFYISVESYSGYGSPDSFYDLTVQCADSGSGPPPVGEEPTSPDDTWTVMLYLNAEDPDFESILTGYRTDIEAFIGSKSSFLKVAILYDGSGDGDTVRYLVQPNGVYTSRENLWNVGELNMGHADTLADFVTWAMDEYPAENYYLAVDDHGNGVYGISYDSTSNDDQLTPPELYSALKGATHNGARKIDILDYEACLMGLAENAYDVRQWVDYVVFSEQISWGIDTYPRYFSDLAATDETEDVGRRIVDRYHGEALVTNNGYGYPHTISLIDTSHMGSVSDAVSNFGDAIRATDTQPQKDAINGARDGSQAFAADYDATNSVRAEYIDLWDLADVASAYPYYLASAQAAAVKSAVDAAVVHERHASGGASGYVWDHSGAHGLAIYYPPSKSSGAFDSYVAPSLYQMSQDGTWDEFLAWAVTSRIRRGMHASRTQDKLAGDDAFAWKDVYLPVVMKAVQ